MNIYSLPIAIEREPAKPTSRDNGERQTKGNAFDAAIKNAGSAKQAGRDAASKTEESVDAAAKVEAAFASEIAEGSIEADPNAVAGAEPAPDQTAPETEESSKREAGEQSDVSLQSLLGMLVSRKTEGDAKAQDKPSAPESRSTSITAVSDENEAGVGETIDANATGKGLRVDVLKMETHFEPRQDGMVLVQPTIAADGDETLPKADRATRSQSVGSSRSKDVSPVKEGSSNDGSVAQGEGEAETAVPMRFDEALARLTRGQSRDGGNAPARDEGRREAAASDKIGKAEVATTSSVSVANVDKTILGTGTGGELGLSQQIAGRMLEVLGEPSSAPKSYAPSSSEAHLRMRAGGGVLKTLTIQLKPEHLGTLDVSMRLSEGRLTVELAASQGDTAVLLTQDRGTLRNLLEKAGFSVDDAAITVVTRDIQVNAPSSSDTSAQGENANRGNTGNGGSNAYSGSGANGEEGRDRRPSPQDRQGTPASNEAPGLRVGSTYL